MAAVWLSLALFVVVVAAGVAYAAARGWQLYRLGKRTAAAFSPALERITGAMASIEGHAAAAEAGSQRAGEAAERLRSSKARLDVQLAAVREARTQMRRVFWFVPGA